MFQNQSAPLVEEAWNDAGLKYQPTSGRRVLQTHPRIPIMQQSWNKTQTNTADLFLEIRLLKILK